jgi:hypothetical protein
MGKSVFRLGVLGVTAVCTALTLPGTASAGPADPTLTGSCDGTLKGNSGQALTLDAGAPLNQPGKLTVGLGSNAAPAGPDSKAPLVPLPVGDAAKALGVGSAPVVGDLATGAACPAVQNTVNAVGAAPQALLSGGKKNQPPPPAPEPPKNPPPAPKPPNGPSNPVPPVPGSQDGPVLGSSGPQPVLTAFPLVGSFSATSPLATPLLVPPIAPGTMVPPGPPSLSSPESVPPKVAATNSGTAEALPTATPPARLPLLLAVLALAVVAAALVRTWMRRKSV